MSRKGTLTKEEQFNNLFAKELAAVEQTGSTETTLTVQTIQDAIDHVQAVSSAEELIALNKANDIPVEEVTEKTVDPLDTPEVNQAAVTFSNLVPQIKGHIDTMSLRQLRRVMKAAMEFPLGEGHPTFVKKEEHELFMMLLHCEGVKTIMKHAIMQTKGAVKEIYDKTVETITEEQLDKIKGNQTNIEETKGEIQ